MIVKRGEMADNNPSVPSVDVKFDVSDPPASAKKILEALRLGEKNQAMASSLLDVQPVTGGITNTLFKCTVCNLFTHSREHKHTLTNGMNTTVLRGSRWLRSPVSVDTRLRSRGHD